MEPSASDGEAARPFSVLLRERRRAAGLTQEALAERAGLSPRTVRGLERGASRPYPDTVARLARALALPPAAAAALAAAPVPHNLPAPLTALVGRERELAEAGRCLADPAGPRLLTLTGPGGGGKTRLALALAARLVAAAGDAGAPGADGAPYPDGVWLAELAALADPSLVPQAVAAAVSVREVPGRPLTETLCRALRARRLLLVLDNCEHLLEACALLATALLRAGPGVRVLATSRRPLGLVGEATWSVPPLAWPAGPAGEALPPAALPAPAALLEYGAVRLFVERARDVWPAFALTAANAPAVVQVCARLDGLPLALELAARQVVVLPPAALAERLDARFRLLTGGPAGPPRQRTLRATLDWSHALLGEAERALFRRLAVFAGGWTLEAAEAVCADDPGGENEEAEEVGGAEVAGGTGGAAPRGHLAAEAVLEALRRLVDQSLVMAVHDPSAEATRYRLLETVRQYAAERLAEAGEGETVRARHAAWAVALAEQGARGALGAHREVWQERLEREQDNFRAALSWALSDPSGPERPDREDPTAPAGPAAGAGLVALQLSGALWRFWSTTGATAEGRVWLERALAATGSGTAGLPAPAGRSADVAALRARALLGAGALAGRRGDFRTARGYDERSLDLYRGLGDWHGIAEALHALAHLAEYRGDTAAVRSLFAESLAAARRGGDPAQVGTALLWLGRDHYRRGGDASVAHPYLEESAELLRAVGDEGGLALALFVRGVIAAEQGDPTTAARLLEEVRERYARAGDRPGVTYALGWLGYVALRRGDGAAAGGHLEQAVARARTEGGELPTWLCFLALLHRTEGGLATAGACLEESLRLLQGMEHPADAARALEAAAGFLIARGGAPRAEQAARLFGAAEAIRTAARSSLPPADRPDHERDSRTARAVLGGAYTAAHAAGEAMTTEEAIACALAALAGDAAGALA